MNLREFIQSEILNTLSEYSNPINEGVMSDLHLLAKQSKTEEEFTNKFFKKYGNKIKKNSDSIEWVKSLYKDTVGESVNEGKFYITRNLGRGQGKALVGYDSPKVFKSYKDAQKEVERLKSGGSMAGQMIAYFVTDKDMNMLKPNGKKMFESVNEETHIPDETIFKIRNGKFVHIDDRFGDKYYVTIYGSKGYDYGKEKELSLKYIKNKIKSGEWKEVKESVNEEQLDEKLITFSNRAPYGQVVFMAGGAGSGKGFAIKNFIDSAGFKVRDVDEMKKSVGELDKLGKFSIDAWYKKYSKNLKPEEREHVEEFVLGKGLSISDVASDLKNPNNVAALHYIVDAMGLKDSWLVNMLSGKTNKETLPNLLFDITAKKVSSISDVIKPLVNVGYDPNNIHLIWVLTDYHLAVQQNKSRERVVPDDILLNTHEGAAKTIWSILTSGLPSGLNGRIDVILNNRENTVTYKDSKGNEMKGAVKGFLSLPIKKQGGGILPEKLWKDLLYKWVSDNGPKTVDLRKPLDTQLGK